MSELKNDGVVFPCDPDELPDFPMPSSETSKRTLEDALARAEELKAFTKPERLATPYQDIMLLADAYRASQAAHDWVAKGDYRDDAACHDIMCSYQAELDYALERLETSQAEVKQLKRELGGPDENITTG